MRVLFLYTEISEYFVACLKSLSKRGVEVHVVRWALNNEAPFRFNISKDIRLYNREQYSKSELKKLAHELKVELIVCSGWVDKAYVSVCRSYKGNGNIVLGIDNPWRGDLKQRIACLIGKVYLKRIFTHAWVPGAKQHLFASKLGFNNDKIFTGVYSADVDLFSSYFRLNNENISKIKVLLYVGRYVEHKGIFDLWNSFMELVKEGESNWELWCVGTGDQYENRIQHSRIKHLGFIQPNDMGEIISKSSAYILPSHFEPWGVTVHEFAAAGLPILCSDKVGSAEVFVENGKNGYVFKSGNLKEIKSAMQTLFAKSDEEITAMRNHSLKLAKRITPSKWSDTVIELLNA